MRRSITAIAPVVLLLWLQSSVDGADLFQWTDGGGVIHFTDNLHKVPESIRKSDRLLVRKGFLVNDPAGDETKLPDAPVNPSFNAAKDNSAAEPQQPEPSSLSDAPQEINVVVENSTARRTKIRSCHMPNCKPGFHPHFNDRQYVHPSVFNGGARQYIHP
jgi:hypothetical protein